MVISEREPKLNQLPLTVFLEDERAKRIDIAGGKGASLAELRTIPGIRVPEAFVLTTSLGDQLLEQNPDIKNGIDLLDGLSRQWLKARLEKNEAGVKEWEEQITAGGELLRKAVEEMTIPQGIEIEIGLAYEKLCQKVGKEDMVVAVRSSGISEDGKDRSFAGQYQTFLNQQGKEEVLDSIKKCLASQFTERVINYRNEGRLEISEEVLKDNPGDINKALAASEELSHRESKLAIVVQRMVNASVAGVGFSVDSETGAKVSRIDVSYGIGESIVSGSVTPDSFDVDPKTLAIIGRSLGAKEVKTSYTNGGTENVEVSQEDRNRFSISDGNVREIARGIVFIRKSYDKEMDIEFAFDKEGELYFLQARPETVSSKHDSKVVKMRGYVISEKAAETARVMFKGGITGCPGVATGILIVADTVEEAKQAIKSKENKGKDIILATNRTDPDWVPIMKKVKGIITRHGGKNCHAAIVSRELRVPCLVGTEEKTEFFRMHKGEKITLDTNKRIIYKGELSLEEVGEDIDVTEILENPTKTVIGVNMSMPEEARKLHALAELGDRFKISLLRIEFLLSDIGVHVNALVDFDKVDKGKLSSDPYLQQRIAEKIAGYGSGREYFITMLSEGIASIAALFPDSDIVLRTTDFKTNEYANLIGGENYEEKEDNPMMGWRGLIRSLCPENREAFKWELLAIKRARDMGYKNIEIMFPVVRDPKELTGGPELDAIGFKGVYEIMEEVGLERGKDNLKVLIMVEDPANVVRINDFIDAGIDGISFGTNDLTQFTLAVDRDNEKIQKIPWYGETNPAVADQVIRVIRACKERGIETGICGQAPSNSPEFVEMLVKEGIDSIGIAPDRYLATYRLVREQEKRSLPL